MFGGFFDVSMELTGWKNNIKSQKMSQRDVDLGGISWLSEKKVSKVLKGFLTFKKSQSFQCV